MKSFASICVALCTLASALPLLPPNHIRRKDDLQAVTDKLLFSSSMIDFQAARAAKNPSTLNWNSNGCSASPDKPLGYDFTQSCQRHDFGYHNFKAQERFSEANKDRIDLNFKVDMFNECEKRSSLSETLCEGVASVYWKAVSEFGGKDND